jgi:hypothetical protein
VRRIAVDIVIAGATWFQKDLVLKSELVGRRRRRRMCPC